MNNSTYEVHFCLSLLHALVLTDVDGNPITLEQLHEQIGEVMSQTPLEKYKTTNPAFLCFGTKKDLNKGEIFETEAIISGFMANEYGIPRRVFAAAKIINYATGESQDLIEEQLDFEEMAIDEFYTMDEHNDEYYYAKTLAETIMSEKKNNPFLSKEEREIILSSFEYK